MGHFSGLQHGEWVVKRIPLRARDGSVRAYALVDDDDFEVLSLHRWNLRLNRGGRRYAQRTVPRTTTVLMHRQIMGFPEFKVDHRDGDGLNNQRANLRLATDALNAQNRRGAMRNSTTGVRGVAPHRRKFRATAQVEGVNHYLGIYETVEEAGEVVAAFWRNHWSAQMISA